MTHMYEIKWKINTESFSLVILCSINILFWVLPNIFIFKKKNFIRLELHKFSVISALLKSDILFYKSWNENDVFLF